MATSSIDAAPEEESCPICMQEYKKGEEALALEACNHAFHRHCISRWLSVRPTCPICRASLPESIPGENIPAWITEMWQHGCGVIPSLIWECLLGHSEDDIRIPS